MIWIQVETTQIITFALLLSMKALEQNKSSEDLMSDLLTWRTPWPAPGRRRGCCRCRAPRPPGSGWAGSSGRSWSRPGRRAWPPSSGIREIEIVSLKIQILACIPFSSLISPQGKSFTATSWEKKINKLELRINFSIPTLRCCLLKLKYNHLGNSRIFSVVTD